MALRGNVPIHFPDGNDKPPVCYSSDVLAEYDLHQHAADFWRLTSRERRQGLCSSRSTSLEHDRLHLYKYRAINAKDENSIGKARAALVHDRIWSASPSSLNDPNDMRFKFVQNQDLAARRLWIRNNQSLLPKLKPAQKLLLRRQLERQRITPEMVADFKQDLEHSTGVFCASTTPRNMQLWTHYAAEHKGFCIQYATYEDELFLLTKRVIYSSEFPILTIPSTPGNNEEYYLRKSLDWEYENERRVVFPLNNCSVVLRPAAISGVIFGAKVEKETIAVVMQLLKEREQLGKPPPKIYRASLPPSSFNIDILSFRQLIPSM